MVIVFLRGGLGNQMFQYAFGLRMARKNGTTLAVDTVFLNDRFPRRNFSYRDYDLGVFTPAPKITLLSTISSTVPLPGVWLATDLAAMHLSAMAGGSTLVKEKSETVFDEAAVAQKGNLVLWGRWQNERYFKDVADEVHQAFTFCDALEGEAADLAVTIAATNSVSLHVRRGDYAGFKNVEKQMGKTDTNYYERAVAYMNAAVVNPHYFIFSDDIEWCKENIKLAAPTTYVTDATSGPGGTGHMRLMSLCKNNIIANSTFSWWAAWLNQNHAKIVVAPEKWLAGDAANDLDIIPEGWKKL